MVYEVSGLELAMAAVNTAPVGLATNAGERWNTYKGRDIQVDCL